MTQLTERLDSFESRLHTMERELDELRRLARAADAAAAAPPPATPFAEEPLWEMLRPEPPVEQPAAPEPPAAPRRAPKRVVEREPFDFSVLLGARALAWTGGVVTLLGIVFFFVLAVERGWIGALARVALGAGASAAVLGGAVWLRRRFGDTYASTSAAGAAIAGFYATLLAATSLYHLVPSPVALLLAAAIAATGATVALAWGSQTLASLGLLGAMLVPVPIMLQGHLSAIGVGFAGLVLAAATAVAVRRNWRALHVSAVVATAPQALVLAYGHHAWSIPVSIVFWLVYGGGALALALRTRLTYLPATLLAFSAAFGGYCAAFAFDGDAQGAALLVLALAYGAVSTVLYRRDRDSASVLWAIGLTLAAVGAATLVSGATLTIVWAAEAALLAYLARRIDEPRFQLASFGWLALAFTHALSADAPVSKLFVENADAWKSVPSVAALAVSSALVGLATFEWRRREDGILAPLFAALLGSQPWIRLGALVLAGATALYGASLAVVALPSTWDWGHVAVAALWSLVAVALVAAGRRVEALALSLASALLVLLYDLPHVAETPRAWAFACVAAAALVVAVVWELRTKVEELDVASLVELAVSVALSTASVVQLLDGRWRGAALLALAVAYGAVAAGLRSRRRDFATVVGAVALVLAVPASFILLHGTWLVLAWAATSVGLAALVRFEDRVSYASLGYFGLAFLHTVAREAPPSALFVAHRHPGGGAPAVAVTALAAAALAWRMPELRRALGWVAAALGLYAGALAVLEGFEGFGGGVATEFQRGHTAVSALWGVIGLGLLVSGLKRRARHLQFGGFALFGVALVKLFLYDLAHLSSITRALSFLAVGAVMIVGGFFYQRLANDLHNGSHAH